MRVMTRIVALVVFPGVLVAVLAGCGSSPSASPAASSAAAASPSPSPSELVSETTIPPTSSTAAPQSPTTTIATASSPDPALDELGQATQAIVVTAPSYGTTTATLTAYQRAGDGWQVELGPWTAHVGYNGIAPPGEKAEGDGRTPSGVYGFGFFFGVQADPGVRFPYRQVTSRSIVWDDDPASALYNQWVDSSQQEAGANPEPMYQPDAYAYGAVIAYNTARTPGAGSAIFLHVSTGGATAGCVSLPSDELLDVLRWLDPARAPRIVLDVG